jgi:hypothetical protein
MIYALQKFSYYLLGSHFKFFTDHSVLKYLVNKPRLGRKNLSMVVTVSGIFIRGDHQTWEMQHESQSLVQIGVRGEWRSNR